MKAALIGVGQAGGKLAEALVREDDRAGYGAITAALAINTARTDLESLGIDTLLVGADHVDGHGVGGDNELGATVMQEDATEALDALDARVSSRAEAIVLVAGLGGGTGSGGAPVLARELGRVYDLPVYALGVLPGRNEGTLYQANAGRSLKTLAREADSVVLVDNDAWHSAAESVGEGYTAINETIAQRFVLLLAAGEVTDAEATVDTSEVINTLRRGTLAALGFASAVAGDDAHENLNAVTSVARNALLTGTSLPDATDAEAALLVVAGRPESISRKGVEHARSWLEEELGTHEVRGGDLPVDSDRLAALVLLGGVERSPRVEAFFDRASEAAAEEPEPADETESLTSDELDDLF